MRKVTVKALYLFLCSILGMVLFAMLHRAIFVLYDLVLIYNFKTFSLGMSEAAILAIDFLTMWAALFLGGWYGVALGLDWYGMVYGPNAEIKPGLFHGFIPHSWRGDRSQNSSNISSMKMPPAKPFMPTSKPVAPKVEIPAPIRTATVRPTPPPPVTKSNVKVPIKKTSEWSFDDFFKATPAPKKRTVAKKTTVKKSVRKTVTK